MPTSAQLLKEASGSYLPRLEAVLYAVFDPLVGPKVVHQVPDGVVATALSTFPTAPRSESVDTAKDREEDTRDVGMVRQTSGQGFSTKVLFDFSSILDFVIPKPELCGHLITKATRTSKILGFPVRIFDEKKYHQGSSVYNRNTFIFNVCFVFERDAELSVFEPIVRKTARTLTTMEESISLLSSPPPDFSMANLLEQLYLEINSFSETSIPLPGADLDLMLFPYHANPREIVHWDVPILIANLEEMKNSSWDITLFKVCPFIDGVNHVKRIAELAEVDLGLARVCVQHLLFYSAIVLVDLFQFSNSYAALPGIADVAQYGEEEDEGVTDLRAECEAYIYSGSGDVPPVPFATLLTFYSTLSPSLTVSSWIDQHSLDSLPIDPRRMIQFGVIKNFLRRVYSYPIWLDHPKYLNATSPTPTSTAGHLRSRFSTLSKPPRTDENPPSPVRGSRPSLIRAGSSLLSGDSSNASTSMVPTSVENNVPPPVASVSASDRPTPGRRVRASLLRMDSDTGGGRSHEHQEQGTKRIVFPHSLPLMCDGKHHTDEICVKYGISRAHLELVLRELGSRNSSNVGGGGGGAANLGDGGKRGGEFGERVVMLSV